jgi:Kelch motif protein
MGETGQGGPLRLGILVTSIAALIVVGVKTASEPVGAGASRATGHGTPGRIIAVPTRRRIPAAVRRQVTVPPTHGAAAIRVAGATYLLGGERAGAHGRRLPVASVLRVVNGGTPTRVAKLPTPVTGAAAAVVGDRLYAIGGRLASGKPSDEVQEYDVATERAVIAARLPKPRSAASALTLDGYVYVLGGATRGGPTASVLRFDPWRDAVFPAGHLPMPAVGGRAAAARLRRGYLIGTRAAGAGRLDFTITLRASLR